ncbi:MAG TPA: RusA family crossover junction endodeoxyribonuclease [Anaerolineales bacterium]|nr:RusA family crossover junction endodeoxyribonuclease [Anaerolineales bacterium]
MISQLSFFVEGEPVAKQSFRYSRRGSFTPARVKAWQGDVSLCAQLAMRQEGELEPMEGNLSVDLTFFLGNARRTDLDNLSKAILDAMNGVAWLDDKQVIRLTIHKFVCRERQGVVVHVEPNPWPTETSLSLMNAMIGHPESLSRLGWVLSEVSA